MVSCKCLFAPSSLLGGRCSGAAFAAWLPACSLPCSWARAPLAATPSLPPQQQLRHRHGHHRRPARNRSRLHGQWAHSPCPQPETPLSPDDRHVSGYPTFNTPPELADAIRAAGYGSCSVASNHAMDQGPRGVAATLGALDRVGVGHAGTARSAAEATRPEIHLVNGIRAGLLAYTYGLNGGDTRPAGQRWLVNFISPRRILADARAAKRAGAQFVAVSLHWGTQYQVAPTAEQRALARTLLASPDIDLLIGSHAHVVQPVERIGDKYVLYGLGNFLSNES